MFDTLRRALDGLWDVLPQRLDLMPRVDLPVYLIHMDQGAEDYFFVFDFDDLVARSRGGVWVRQRFRLMAGRDDFDRQRFAGYFRQCFSREFDAMRDSLAAESENGRFGGWFGRAQDGVWLSGSALGALSLIVLWLAVSAGRALLPRIPVPRLMRARDKKARLEAEIDALKSEVDRGLEAMEVTLHADLQFHAIARGGPGDPDALDVSDWPLPEFVSQAMKDALRKENRNV